MLIKKEITVRFALSRGVIHLYVYNGVVNRLYSLGKPSTHDSFETDCVSLDPFLKKAEDIIERMRLLDVEFNFESFKYQFFGTNKETSIINHSARFIKTLTKENTKTFYKDSVKSILAFSGTDISYGQITPDWIRRYLKYCDDNEISKNTANIYLRHLRALHNRAKEEGLAPEKKPFKGFNLNSTSSELRYLDKAELEVFVKFPFKDKTGKMKWREAKDLFLFSYHSFGLNLKDILELQYSKIKNNHFVVQREKTEGKAPPPIRIPINKQMQEIMDIYFVEGEDSVFSQFIPKVVLTNEQKEKEHKKILGWIADNIKRIAKAADIKNPEELVFYSARHTFAVHFLKFQKDATIYKLMRCFGHQSERSTRNYITKLLGENDMVINFYDEMFAN